MATKTDYYNRIIASLQSEITGLKTTVSELQKEMEGMRETMKKVTELKTSAKPITIEATPAVLSLKTLPRKEVEILISKMKTVCDEAIKVNHENYVKMFTMRSELSSLRDHIETSFLSAEKFRGYQAAQETRFKSIEEKIGKRFSLLTVKQSSQTGHHNAATVLNLLPLLSEIRSLDLRWVISLCISVFIALLAFYILSSIKG